MISGLGRARLRSQRPRGGGGRRLYSCRLAVIWKPLKGLSPGGTRNVKRVPAGCDSLALLEEKLRRGPFTKLPRIS